MAYLSYWFAVMPMVGLLVAYHLAFTVPALFFLRDRDLDQSAQAVWVLVIVSVPFVGVLAFAILQPGRRPTV